MEPTTKLLLSLIGAIAGLIVKYGLFALTLYQVGKCLIRYNAKCQDQYIRHRQAEQDLDNLQDEINSMKDHDWSKEPPKQ